MSSGVAAVVPGIRPRLPFAAIDQYLLSHGQPALYPLAYLPVIDGFGVSAATIATSRRSE